MCVCSVHASACRQIRPKKERQQSPDPCESTGLRLNINRSAASGAFLLGPFEAPRIGLRRARY